jgi:Carboxypeptidase regulatory-like domain
MTKSDRYHMSVISAVALLIFCAFVGAGSAQKGPQGTTGAPLKGVDVKLGKNPGSKPAARTTTDGDGKFSFPVVPAGDYILTAELKKEDGHDSAVRYCFISVNEGGTKTTRGFDLVQNKAFDAAIDPAKQAASKMKLDNYTVHSDGAHPLNGTIVKSKSNITNN